MRWKPAHFGEFITDTKISTLKSQQAVLSGVTQKREEFGNGSPPVPPLFSRNWSCLVPAFFFHFFQPHTSTLTTQTGSCTHSYTPSQIKCSNYYFWSVQMCARPFTKYTTWRLPHAHSSDSDPKILLQLSLQMSRKTFFDSTSVDQALWPNGWTHGFLCFSWAGCLKKINTPTATWLCIPN